MRGGGGATHHTRAMCVWTGGPGQLATAPVPPLVTSARCPSLLAGSQFEVKLVSCPKSPLSPHLSVHVITVSSLHRNANLVFLFFCVPRSCIKFAFPLACVPKTPGTRELMNAGAREHETRNARPSLIVSMPKKGTQDRSKRCIK